jgi:hypothetical protein
VIEQPLVYPDSEVEELPKTMREVKFRSLQEIDVRERLTEPDSFGKRDFLRKLSCSS